MLLIYSLFYKTVIFMTSWAFICLFFVGGDEGRGGWGLSSLSNDLSNVLSYSHHCLINKLPEKSLT